MILLFLLILLPLISSSFIGLTTIRENINGTIANVSLEELSTYPYVDLLTIRGFENATVISEGIYHWLSKVWIQTKIDTVYYYVTPNHSWFLQNGTRTTDLQEGDSLLTIDKTSAIVRVIGSDTAPGDFVYSIKDDSNSFILSSGIITGGS